MDKFDNDANDNYNIIIEELRFEWDENKNNINKLWGLALRKGDSYESRV